MGRAHWHNLFNFQSDILYLDNISARRFLPEIFNKLEPPRTLFDLHAYRKGMGSPSSLRLSTPNKLPGLVPRVGLVIFDGLKPPHEYTPSMQSMYTLLGCQKLSVLYIPGGASNLDLGHQRSYINRRWIDSYGLPRSLDSEPAATLLINSIGLQSESLPTEDRQTAGQISQVYQ